MGRTLVCGDIHGHYRLLMAALTKASFNPDEDKLVCLGDYIDRGPESKKVVSFLTAGTTNHPERITCIKGNHEQMMIDYLGGGRYGREWIQNGGWSTINSYMGKTGNFEPDLEHVGWMAFLPEWHEDEFAIYVHAGLPRGMDGWLHPGDYIPGVEDERLWTRRFSPDCGYEGKLVIVGHTPTVNYKQAGHIIVNDCTVHMDTGTWLTGVLTLLELPTMQEYIAADPDWMQLAPNYKEWKQWYSHHPRSVGVNLGPWTRPKERDFHVGLLRMERYEAILARENQARSILATENI